MIRHGQPCGRKFWCIADTPDTTRVCRYTYDAQHNRHIIYAYERGALLPDDATGQRPLPLSGFLYLLEHPYLYLEDDTW